LTPIHQFRGHGHSILGISFVKDNWIITASRDHTIRIWDIETKSEVKQLLGHRGSVNSIEIIDQDRIASASGDATIKIWNIHTGLCTSTIDAKQLGLATIRFNGQHLFSGGLNGKIKAWDIETGECVNTLTGHISMIRSIDCIQVREIYSIINYIYFLLLISCAIFKGKIVSGSYDRTLKVWDAKTGACLLCFQSGHSNWIFNVLSSNTRIIR
jgi:F-box and WD-40 domain protein 1/11